MTSIFVIIERIYRYQFKCNDLHYILNILKEKNESHSSRISEIIDSQGCGYLNAKKDPGSENLSAANVLMSPKNS